MRMKTMSDDAMENTGEWKDMGLRSDEQVLHIYVL
jgi:hypothetical protein